MDVKKRKILIYTFCFFTAFFCITICSKNSFLYAFNDWVDGNAFFTMGKGWMNKMIPYRDLFEQKGPLLYLIYGIGYIISPKSFLGIYLLECCSFTIFLIYIYKIAKEYLKEKSSLLITVLVAVIISSSLSFVQGGSAEEFCLPLLAISFYHFLKNMKSEMIPKSSLLINGLIAGLIAMIKFNLLGFWFIWMALTFFFLLYKKKIKEAFLSCGYFLIGMMIPIIGFSLYFFIVGGFKDFFQSYIIFNVSSYTVKETFLRRIFNMVINIKNHMLFNKEIFYLTITGFLGILCLKKIESNLWVKIFTLLSFIFLSVGIYIGGIPYTYYYLLNEFYIIFGCITLLYFLEKGILWQKIELLGVIIGIIIAALIPMKSENLKDIHLKKEDYVQYKFDEKIKKVENPTLLNYDALDGGFYTASNILPNTKYFMMQNVSFERFPMILETQNKMISEKKVDFVVVREYEANQGHYQKLDILVNNYNLIQEEKKILEGIEFTYYLYQKK